MKKILVILCTLIMCFNITACNSNSSVNNEIKVENNKEDVSIKVDEELLVFDIQPQIEDGNVIAPMEEIFDSLNVLFKYDEETKTISARKGGKTINLVIDSDTMTIDKGDVDENNSPILENVKLKTVAKIISDKVLIPIKEVSEVFGKNFSFNKNTYEVIITSDVDDNSWENNKKVYDLSEIKDTLQITKGGDYTLSGKLNGSVVVNTKDQVKLRLLNVDIITEGAPCIYIEDADQAYITIEDNTDNKLQTNFEDGAIYSKDDLEIKGYGNLSIISTNGKGIKASNDLEINNGNINIISTTTGIKVNDTFKLKGGEVNIETVEDGLVSDSIVQIKGGKINITTTLEPEKVDKEVMSENFGKFNPMEDNSAEFSTSAKGMKADWYLQIIGGEININSTDHAIHSADIIEITDGILNINSKYGKGISGHGDVLISGNDTVINIINSTEGIESKDVLKIDNGIIDVYSTDDTLNAGGSQGMHFGNPGEMQEGIPNDFKRENGERPNREFPEGMNFEEGFTPENMPNFEGMTPPEMHGKGGMGGGGFNMPAMEGLKDVLIINGGTFNLRGEDDVLDANGNLVLNGGIIKAENRNASIQGVFGVIDADGPVSVSEDVTLVTICQNVSNPQLNNNNTITIYNEEVIEKIKILRNEELIIEYIPKDKVTSSVFISSPNIKLDETYKLIINDIEQEIKISEQNTVIGEVPERQGMNGFGGRGPNKDFTQPPKM